MNNFASRAKEIIAKILYITIATVSDRGKPWNTPLYSSFDKQYNFFWVSSPLAQHSRNIARNNSVFLAIYDSTVSEGTGEGVYIKAKAFELSDETEIERALQFAYGRKNKTPRPAADFMKESPRRVYKAVIEKVWMNTLHKVEGHPVDARVEIQLR